MGWAVGCGDAFRFACHSRQQSKVRETGPRRPPPIARLQTPARARFDVHARTQGELIKKKTMALAKEEQETEARRKREAREAMVSPVPAQMWAG